MKPFLSHQDANRNPKRETAAYENESSIIATLESLGACLSVDGLTINRLRRPLVEGRSESRWIGAARCGLTPGFEAKRRRTALAVLLGGLFLALTGPSSLFGGTVTLSPASDAYVNDSDPLGTYNNAWLVAGHSPAEFTPRYRTFLRFNLSGIPSNATVSSAVLRLNLQAVEGASTAGIELRRVLASWTSTTLTWSNQPAATTPVTTTAVGSTRGADYNWPITGLAQGWVGGQYSNYGLTLRIVNEATATATRTFASANHATNSIRPELIVTYTLPPDITVAPGSLAFGNQVLNTLSPPQTLTVSNTGNGTLTVNAISTSSGVEFSLSNVPSLPANLAPGTSLSFQVRFKPASIGARSETVSILSNDPDEPISTVVCTGTGVAPKLSVAPSELSFGNITLGTTRRQTLSVSNAGNASLVISNITGTNSVFKVENAPSLPLTLLPGQVYLGSVAYTPEATRDDSGLLGIGSNDPETPGIVIPLGGAGVEPPATGCEQPPVAGVMPVITSPADGSIHIVGNPIQFQAANAAGAQVLCNANCYELCWYFRKLPDQRWEDVVGYQFTQGRLLGCDQAIPLPGDYEVKVKMCGVESVPGAFQVVYGPRITDPEQIHPLFGNPDHRAYRCEIDWTDADHTNRLSTAHFNVIWTTNRFNDGDPCNAPSGGYVNNRPTDRKLGLMECAWATLDRWMTDPLDASALYRNVEGYSELTHLTWWVGGAGGGGVSQPMGIGTEQSVRGDGVASRLAVHEMFHTWDYAGNPLHNKPRFDRRSQGNPYVFFHEAPTRIAQTMASNAPTLFGYKSDQWPVWNPLDMGLLELGYDAGIFWAYLMNSYPFAPRLSWEGPSICGCAQWAEPGRLPHNFELFELWNARVRARVRAELGPDVPLTEYRCGDEHWPTEGDRSFIYNGHVQPVCFQTLEYELAVLEGLIRERFPFQGTPLAESLLLDFAVKFAQAFPPRSLGNGMPFVQSCDDLTEINFSNGFADQGQPDSLVCDGILGFNTNDFYARIKFRIRDSSVRYLRLTANDEATLYVEDRAVIEPLDSAYPNASTTYADQRNNEAEDLSYTWAGTAEPRSSVIEVANPTRKEFEIEWVNRGDGRGNGDASSRYSLRLEACESLDEANPTCSPLSADQIEIISAHFWPNQGSGAPGFASTPVANELPTPLVRELQLRPVSSGERPFFLPPLGVHYHPVESPDGYTGQLEVTVRHDGLTHTQPSAHLLVLRNNGVEWIGALEQIDENTQRACFYSHGDGSPATYQGDPAFLVVVARRTDHGFDSGPARYGTMGAIHYTVRVQSNPLEADRYDVASSPNDTLARATNLPNVDGGDVFGDPGNPPFRIWGMTVADLTLHDPDDVDYFCVDLPDEAGDDCPDQLPGCAMGARVANGMLVVTVGGGTETEIVAYDQQGNEIGRDDNYLCITCPRERGLDHFCFSVSSKTGCPTGYFLDIDYSVPDGIRGPWADLCIPCPRPAVDCRQDDSYRVFDPWQRLGQEYVFGINCNTIVCQPFKHDYLLFHWSEAGPMEVEFQHPVGTDFAFDLLDERFNRIAGSAPAAGAAAGVRVAINPLVTQLLSLTYLPTGYYALRVTGSQFGTPFSMRFITPGAPPLRIDGATARWTGSQFEFRWTAEAGRRYQVQYTERLGEMPWMNLGAEIAAATSIVTFRDPEPGTAKRFYRILRVD